MPQSIDLAVLKAFEASIVASNIGFRVRFKDESLWLRLLGYLVFPFNPKFMTHYATTLGKTVWFPSREFYEAQPTVNFGILAHELVHVLDEARLGYRMALGVVFPQVLGLIPLVLYGVFGRPWSLLVFAILLMGLLCSLFVARRSLSIFAAMFTTLCLGAGVLALYTTSWWVLLLGIGGLCLFPWPSPTRTASELRGYAMQLGLAYWIRGSVSDHAREAVLQYFVGSDYYYMSWSRVNMLHKIDAVVARAESGELQKEEPYGFVHAFCAKHELLNSKGS